MSTERLIKKAEILGMYTVESERRGFGYIYNNGEYAICTPQGVARLSELQFETVVSELMGFLQDVKDLKRMEVLS